MSRKPNPAAELRRARAAVAKDKHEIPFLNLWRSRYPELPVPERDFKFAECVGRKFAIDWAFPEQRLGVELEGGGGRSRHSTVMGYAKDCDKYNLAVELSWAVLRFNVIHLKRMVDVVDLVARVLKYRVESAKIPA